MTARQVLWELAVDQYGYVTVRQALELGIDRLTVDKLAARGQLERAAHGVYRFPQLPVTEFDAYMLAVLWTGARDACLSHDTALAAYEVSDINPDRIHLTVPKLRRVRRRGGDLYLLHHEDLTSERVGWWQQIPAVTLPTAIAQCTVSGVPGYLLRQALAASADRGALTPAETQSLSRQLEARDGG
ncbi:MAG: type IV toxin-antitoxin system AbiEi family antitoxin domain-containing protein [Mycobacteriales bacterium]